MTNKLNDVERTMIQERFDSSYDYIRSQNSIKKELRNTRAIEKAKKVRDTTGRWLKECK